VGNTVAAPLTGKATQLQAADKLVWVLFLMTPLEDINGSSLNFRWSNGDECINGIVVFHIAVVDDVNTGV
jgi:hypothetical protein